MPPLRAMVIFGGPSGERGISMNSARSVVDQLRGGPIEVGEIIYVDTALERFALSPGQLYSNTPLDFDFKRQDTLTRLSDEDFAARCKGCDLVIPVIHGAYGEDGAVQAKLEELGVPFTGSGSHAAEHAYDKALCHKALEKHGIPCVPTLRCAPDAIDHASETELAPFLGAAGFVIKPARGGSSLGIEVIRHSGGLPAIEQLQSICRDRADQTGLLIQPLISGREFSVVVLGGAEEPVALIPVGIERAESDLRSDIFSFHEKYLPTEHVRFRCPPPIEEPVIGSLRSICERVFADLGLRDWARIDCWLLDDGTVLVSDVNPISGAEQNSIIFISAAECGLTHSDLLLHVFANALRRRGQSLPRQGPQADDHRQRVRVLFGGESSERQVSVLSGVNAWLKLRGVPGVEPEPYFLDRNERVARLSYPAALLHSVEEIEEYTRRPDATNELARSLGAQIRARLGIENPAFDPACGQWEPLDDFLTDPTPVFLGLHGGIGENGSIQQRLDARGIAYNGSPADVCRLCMNKLDTARRIAQANIPGVLDQRSVEISASKLTSTAPAALWAELTIAFEGSHVVLKPAADGCSTGVVVLASADELSRYAKAIGRSATEISGKVFSNHSDSQIIAMPMGASVFMAEPYIATDSLGVSEQLSGAIEWGLERDTGWIEVTAGVIEVEGQLECLTPSLSVAEKGVLSKEEKFMGGTGINYTPPPAPPYGRVRPEAVARAKESILGVAEALGVRGYARIDAFMHRDSGEIIVIEANALPALTPSTVLFQQGVARSPSLLPHELLALLCPVAAAPAPR